MNESSSQYVLNVIDQGKNNNFDLIRFLAASLVIFSHSYLLTKSFDKEPLKQFLGFLDFGAVSVYVFFLISGYLITKSMYRQQSLGKFVWARALRIFPALVICSFGCALVVGPLLTNLPIVDYFSSGDVYRYALGNSTLIDMTNFLPGVFEGNPYSGAVNSSTWTLKAEMLMYIVVFAFGVVNIVRDVSKSIKNHLCVILLVIFYFIILHYTYHYVFEQARLWIIFFMLGMMAFFFSKQIILKVSYTLTLGVLLGFCVFLHAPGLKLLVFISIAYSLLVFAFHPKLQFGNFSKFGDFSYGLYIYGFPIQQAVVLNIPNVSPVQLFLLSYSVTLPLAIFSWHFIEKPALSLKNVSWIK